MLLFGINCDCTQLQFRFQRLQVLSRWSKIKWPEVAEMLTHWCLRVSLQAAGTVINLMVCSFRILTVVIRLMRKCCRFIIQGENQCHDVELLDSYCDSNWHKCYLWQYIVCTCIMSQSGPRAFWLSWWKKGSQI